MISSVAIVCLYYLFPRVVTACFFLNFSSSVAEFLENVEDDPYIYFINLLDSNLDIDFDMAQTELINEPDILPSISPNEVHSFSTNNLVFTTPDPIKNTRKRTKYAVTTPPFIASHPQKKKCIEKEKISVNWTHGTLSPQNVTLQEILIFLMKY